tara:strand:+ start:1513 stop:1974 length:462 start_codon:yes stop_codon:yes gene_type:complete
MNNGVDLNAIPGERASKGSKVRNIPLVKNSKNQMLGNEYVEVKPLRHHQRNLNLYQKPRVHVPAYHNPPVPFDWYDRAENRFEHERNPPTKFFSIVFTLFLYATVVTIVGGVFLLAIDPLFWFISTVLSFLWALLKIIFWIYIVLLVLSLVSG